VASPRRPPQWRGHSCGQTVQACDVVGVDAMGANSNVQVEAVHELRQNRQDNIIGIIGGPFVRSSGLVGLWARVPCQHLVVYCSRVTGTHAVTKDAGCSATDTVGLGIEDTVCRSFEASSLVHGLPLAGGRRRAFLRSASHLFNKAP
jgi:hypothetical protein